MTKDNDITTILFEIERAADHRQRLEHLALLETALESRRNTAELRSLKSLLYHRDWYIRREAAFLVDRFGVAMNAAEQLQYQFALQNFEALREKMENDPQARQVLFEGCRDISARFRSRIPGRLALSDCRSPREIVWWHYAGGDYRGLLELGCEPDFRPEVVEILRFGLQPQNNSAYHRKQCAFALEQLKEIEDAGSVVHNIISSEPEKRALTLPEQEEIAQLSLTPLEKFLRRLQAHGLFIDGQKVFPTIQMGSATRRITYRRPGVQTWPAEERLRRLQPPDGRCLLRFDYRAIEPTLLLHFLLQRFLISMEDLPAGDIYTAINPQDREAAKTWLNAVINGGGLRYARRMNPLQTRLWEAVQELRQELLQQVYREKAVEILGGEQLPLDPAESNLGGKAVNRLVQGSAAALFNHAVLQLHRLLQQSPGNARIYFLLFDEVWVEMPAPAPAQLSGQIAEVLEAVNQEYGLLVPLQVRREA